MAFQQELKFEKLDYSYDRRGDVLDISFGPPAPAVALQVEDWLAIQVRLNPPPTLQGMTIVGSKKIFDKISQYAERELPKRVRRLARTVVSVAYNDASDTLVYRIEESETFARRWLRRLSGRRAEKLSIFEPLSRTTGNRSLSNVYVEKSLPSNDIVGIKILEFTKCGPSALEGVFGAMIDTLFEPAAQRDENIHLITNAVIARFDWQRFAALAA